MPVPKADYLRSMAMDYAKRFIGLPGVWGGDDPVAGFDCSGFIIEVLQSVGLIPHGSDFTANGLFVRFRRHEIEKGYAGCLVFWLDSQARATHVELMIDDYHVVGASGVGSATKTRADAIAHNAYVKQRPLHYRGWTFKIIDPFQVVV